MDKKINCTIPCDESSSGVTAFFGASDSSNAAKTKTEPVDRATLSGNQLYTYDMIVKNGWGGSWFDKNYRNTLTPESFKIGDILYIWTSDIKTWYLLYTGDGRFVAYNSTSKENTGTVDMDTVLHLWLNNKEFTYTLNGTATPKDPGTVRYYILLRPSQILDQLTPDQPETPVEPSIGRELTVEEKTAISAITAAQATTADKNNLVPFADWVYGQIGIDTSNVLDLSVADMLKAVIGQGISSNPIGLRTDNPHYPMLVPNSWGGTLVSNSSIGTYILPEEDYEIGDILIMHGNHGSTVYWTAVYQGNGNFLIDPRGAEFVMTYDTLAELMDGGEYSGKTYTWYRYAVLRPVKLLTKTVAIFPTA